ncbi:MAG: metallophosphoesterase family protein [Planctomycetota bacterium]|nr:metallophosphoesterase family protein [Planctomycetota bacterium]
MEPIAVISDVHSNLEALTAVLDDISARQIKEIICLGDVVGYGPQPAECLDLVLERCRITLMGNHDFAVMYEPSNFNFGAEGACYWTREILEAETDKDARARRWEFLGSLPVKSVLSEDECPVGQTVLVHGSPRRPINEYIFPDDVYNAPNKIQSLFERFENLCLIGHAHVPGVFLPTPDFYTPDELGGVYEMDDHKAMINVGSVGQPRDRDTRAGYVILQERSVQFVRIAYDVEATISKVHAIRELDNYLGNRLREGR